MSPVVSHISPRASGYDQLGSPTHAPLEDYSTTLLTSSSASLSPIHRPPSPSALHTHAHHTETRYNRPSRLESATAASSTAAGVGIGTKHRSVDDDTDGLADVDLEFTPR